MLCARETIKVNGNSEFLSVTVCLITHQGSYFLAHHFLYQHIGQGFEVAHEPGIGRFARFFLHQQLEKVLVASHQFRHVRRPLGQDDEGFQQATAHPRGDTGNWHGY